MAQLVSAKKLLVNYDPTTPTDDEGKKYRGTAHEFQDYAYRLASDLNDREHLHIYMKFAKEYPRYLLEEVYQFIADIDEHNKGKLFMWKFKQVRDEIRLQKDLKNFDYEFIIKKTRKLQDKLHNQILKKEANLDNNHLAKFMSNIKFDKLDKSSKVLFLSTHSLLVPTAFIGMGTKVFGLGITKNIVKSLKDGFKHIKNVKFISKDFFKNSYKDFQFDLIIVDKYWKYIPFEQEQNFLKECKRILNVDGEIILQVKTSDEEIQEWSSLTISNETEYYFNKRNSEEEIRNLFSSNGFNVINEYSSGSTSIFRLKTKN